LARSRTAISEAADMVIKPRARYSRWRGLIDSLANVHDTASAQIDTGRNMVRKCEVV
jgi:hypothetical protein